jgi:hypothetical protein
MSWWLEIDLGQKVWRGIDRFVLAKNRDIKCWEVFEWKHNWWPLEKCSSP